ncbi:MAG: UDP-N-acetylmuramoyl-tripeptide--D-alanyl-D-alanine ligase [Candidatus Shapirobacteria bacterium]|nr:UDP-N-acetylmuramoyl-tripeptide--D-alanyl-D-alanine ligase [Candidatus Shapirobacteria bacterium]
MIWLQLGLFFIGIHQLFYWVYIWQLKEYRFDRWWDWLKSENGWWWKQFNILKWYRPKMTIRALLTISIGLVFVWWEWKYWWLTAFIFSGFLVEIWAPLFDWQKRRIISRAKLKIKQCKGVVIGITGSFGKTTTKDMLAEVLSKKYKVVSTPKNINTEIGVAQTVLEWPNDFEIAVVEMGAYKIGEIGAICEIVKPKYGIITGLGDQHLSLFGSLENIKKAKYELINSLPKSGKGWVIDKDFSLSDVNHIKEYRDGVSFNYKKKVVCLPLLGRKLITNAIVVIKVAGELGMSDDEILLRLKNLNTNNYWPKKIEVNSDLSIIDNTYNASLNSFLSLLDYMRVWKGYNKILVTPGMIELGNNGKKDHEEIGRRLKWVDLVLLTKKKYFKEMNVNGNVKVVRLGNLLSEIKKHINGKTLVVFKSRIPNFIIDKIKNG